MAAPIASPLLSDTMLERFRERVGLGRRVLDLTVDNLKTKTSITISSGSLIHHPEVQQASNASSATPG